MVLLQIIILCELHQFRVAVDGLHQLVYKHRVPDLKQITEVEVLGDVQLLSLRTSETTDKQQPQRPSEGPRVGDPSTLGAWPPQQHH